MGHTRPKPLREPLTGESFHLSVARDAYVDGQIDVDEFEQAAERILSGQPHGLRLPGIPSRPSPILHNVEWR